jgi:NADH-quinone oxidoreductase subunit L
LLIALLVGLPLITGAALLVLRPGRDAATAGTLTAAGTLAVAAVAAAERPAGQVPLFAGIPAGFAVDGMSAVAAVLAAAVLPAALIVAAAEPDLRTGRFHGLMLLFTAGMLATVTATTLPPLLMAWEVMGATSWALIGHRLGDSGAARAGTVAFLTTRTADLGLYVAAGAMLAGGDGTMALDGLGHLDGVWLHVAVGGFTVAALGKAAQLPFSFWLSGAMRGPAPVSALLHSATMVAAGGYLLLRVAPALDATGWAAPLVAWTGAATAVLMGLVAVAQDDLKQLLAASTCAQLGYIVLAAGTAGIHAGLLQMVAHAAAKSLLFLIAGVWLAALGSGSLTGGLRGAARRHPATGLAFTTAGLSLAGLAPLGLWFSKDAVLAAALRSSPALYAAGLTAALIAALYSGRALRFVLRPATAPADTGPGAARITVAPSVTAVTLVLAVAAAGAGLLALGPEPLRPDPVPYAWELVLSAVLAAAGALLAWRSATGWPSPAAATAWLYPGEAALRGVARPVLRLAVLAARADERGLSRVPELTGRAAVALARATDRRGERALDAAVGAVAAGARALGRAARRPQTGQVHQYYAQASLGFTLLAVLAVLLIVAR